MTLLKDYQLKPYNTFGLDVKADYLAKVHTSAELIKVLEDNSKINSPMMVLGGGSNVLFTGDFHGLIIHNLIKGIEEENYSSEKILIKAGAGVVWHELVQYTVDKGYGGLENLSLIPGFVGAAPIQNIGAYGVEMKDTFLSLEAFEISTGKIKSFHKDECRFGYRDSIFKSVFKNHYIICSVSFLLNKNPVLNTSYGAIEEELKKMNVNVPDVKTVSQAVINIRRSKLPDPAVIGNAGSFFKNPEVSKDKFERLKEHFPSIVGYNTAADTIKLAAGWMIEQSGWKGKRSGRVGMHDKQALVLVNYGGASGKELIDHAMKVQQDVKQKFDVLLEMEVNVVQSEE